VGGPLVSNGPVHADVAIVGCGPVGVVLAGLLARRGVRVVAFDRDVDPFPLPRAAHFDHEIMRVFQELGVADEIAASTIVTPGMDFLTADREVLMSMRGGSRTPSGWPGSILFHQPGVERSLRAAAIRLGAELRLGGGVDRFTDDGTGVTLHLADGTEYRASFLVGCDGARSTVRKQLDITMDDLGFEEPWLVLDLVLHDGVEPPSEVALQVCDPARPHTLVPMPPPRYRFEFMLLPGEQPDEIDTPERAREFLAAWIDPDEVEIERSAVYTFHGLIADEWRRGRVMIAGDAAHQTPPFLGQGMCAGIRDAANLAWKLHRIVEFGAPESILDTYRPEREPQVRSIIGAAVDFGRIICTTDPSVAAERNAGMLAARALDDRPKAVEAPLPALSGGPLVGPGGGALSVQPTVDGVRLDETVGSRWAVVTSRRDLLDSDGAGWWSAFGAVLLSVDDVPETADVLAPTGADAVVIRPDRHLFTAGATVEPPTVETAEMLGATHG
jgi:3-(3-hydroxy-phenyl)propionate hydroxylase